jgi:hypothetical protein
MLGVTSLAGASAAPLARRSATPLGVPSLDPVTGVCEAEPS